MNGGVSMPSASTASSHQVPLKVLRAAWTARSARERTVLALAGALLLLFLLWSMAVQPAWRTLQRVPVQIAVADAQMHAMRVLAEEARTLRTLPPAGAGQGAAALQAAAERLGPRARLSLQAERAVLTLDGLSPEEFSALLAEARVGARARPVEARLNRSDRGLSGTLVMDLGVPG
jgi:general secretion pathway protein M